MAGSNKLENVPTRALVVEATVFCVFLCCAVLIGAVVVVDSVASTEMYRSLGDATQSAIDRSSAEAASHIYAQLEAIAPMSYELTNMVASALATPQTPTTAELASYGMVYNTVAGCWIYVSQTNFGGPAQVLYNADKFNETALNAVIQNYFFRTAVLGPYFRSVFLATNDMVVMGFMGSVQKFGLVYPFLPLQQVKAQFESHPLNKVLSPEADPTHKYAWSEPFRNVINQRWVVSLGAPLYGGPGFSDDTEVAFCGYNIYITKFLAYADNVSQLLPWDAYVVIATSDGTLLAVPQAGSQDWSGNDSSTFNYTMLASSATFDANVWNIMKNPIYADIGHAINKTTTYPPANASAGQFITVRPGSATVHFHYTGERLISWDFVPSARWIVITVIDQDKALHAQASARLLIILMSALAGGMVLAAAVAVAVYGAVKLQYVRLSNRISDLSQELELAKLAVAQNALNDPDEATVGALAGGLQRITETLTEVANSNRPVTVEQALVLRDAIKVLLNRDFTVVQPTTELNDDQEQFILDCGMDVRSHNTRPVTTSAMLGTLTDVTQGERINMETDVQVDKWEFDVFQVREPQGRGVITNVVWSALRDAGLFNVVSLDESKLLCFLSELDAAYCGHVGEDAASAVEDNPYHNRQHAADVTQAMYFILGEVIASSPRMRQVITPLDRLACILACAIHDYKHPGRNNMFLRSTFHPTHVDFYESALERFHAASGCHLLFTNQECLALSGLTRAEQLELHATIFKLILATDMAKHVEFLDAFKAWSAVQQRGHAAGVAVDLLSCDPVVEIDEQSKMLVLQVLIKAADLSNAFREWRVCHEWTMRVAREFGQQGQQERSLGLAVSKFMDGSVSPQDMQVRLCGQLKCQRVGTSPPHTTDNVGRSAEHFCSAYRRTTAPRT
eukprot:TRINITY_DN3800_c0_g1_i2.p1 TRINITY_DN3800_c0_g1~~TRINITY_DN3800_c0_g1_i2.p1  ORF type:complete len:909 (-),score=173.75 TRINITY_DN3800_c0_g1_i2:173-2899(-)